MNPYSRLKETAKEWIGAVRFPQRRGMFLITDFNANYRLTDILERVRAADQLGFDVKVEEKDRGLHFVYVKRPPVVPWELQD